MSIFPTKILLATDGSEEATLAARTAAEIADKTASELHVVYTELIPVYGEFPSGRLETSEAVEKEVRNKAQRFLDDQVKQIEAGGGTVAQAHVRLGRPDEEIITQAEEIGAGLIVIGSRGLGGMRRALMGSVSDSVVRHAHCPVLVARREEKDEEVMGTFPTKILIATDGSEEATLAARTAVDLADKTNSELHVVYVGELDYGYSSYVIPDPEYMQKVQEELTQEARKLLDAEVDQIRAAGGSLVEAHLSMGSPDVEIVKLAEEIGAGLIVVGSRGLGGIGRALMGSVSDSVVRHAHCPVLVVRETSDPKRER